MMPLYAGIRQLQLIHAFGHTTQGCVVIFVLLALQGVELGNEIVGGLEYIRAGI